MHERPAWSQYFGQLLTDEDTHWFFHVCGALQPAQSAKKSVLCWQRLTLLHFLSFACCWQLEPSLLPPHHVTSATPLQPPGLSGATPCCPGNKNQTPGEGTAIVWRDTEAKHLRSRMTSQTSPMVSGVRQLTGKKSDRASHFRPASIWEMHRLRHLLKWGSLSRCRTKMYRSTIIYLCKTDTLHLNVHWTDAVLRSWRRGRHCPFLMVFLSESPLFARN